MAATLQKSSLRKKDLALELEELEEAATMVAEEEGEEQGASKSALISSGDSSTSSDSSRSSSESSDESEESEAEGQGCTESSKGGGGGEGGETTKHNPLQPQPTSAASPIPQEPTSTLFLAEGKADALPSASDGSRQLIQELGELRICPDLYYKAERNCSQLSGAATETDETSGRCSSGTLLEPSPRRNPLLTIQTQNEDDEEKMMMRVTSS